ncbi:MAG: ABC transporter substrate-binding protein [Pseudonocardiaceae bacterium]
MAQRTALRAVALLGALSVVMAGCGSGGDNNASAPGTEPPATSVPAEKVCDPPAKASGQPSTEPLKIGSLLPETGSLAILGPPEFAAVDVAIAEVNAAGGVLGNDVTHFPGDSGDASTDTANQTVNRQLNEDVQVIIGAAASGVTKLVVDKITGAGVVQFSPANTSSELTCLQDKGLYFRTAPPDVLQGQALAQLISTDGAQRVSILARNDSYGSGLADETEKNLLTAGIQPADIQKKIYDPTATSYNVEIDSIKQFDPDAIAVIGFDESKRILTRMSEVQIGPAQKQIYGTDGNTSNQTGEGLAPGLLEGMKGTSPATKLSSEFQQRLLTQDPELVDFVYAAEAYDAVMITALAAEQAKSTKGVDIGSEINGITKEGEKCTTFADCKEIIEGGTNIDYDGVTGTLDFVDAGERSSGSYGVFEFDAQNQIPKVTTEFILIGS